MLERAEKWAEAGDVLEYVSTKIFQGQGRVDNPKGPLSKPAPSGAISRINAEVGKIADALNIYKYTKYFLTNDFKIFHI